MVGFQTMSARTDLTYALRTALAGIGQDSGFNTWIGRLVHVGMRQANETETPCCVLTPGTETPVDNAEPGGSTTIEYSISGFVNRLETAIAGAPGDPHDEYAIVDAMIEDIRLAIEGDGLSPCPINDARMVQYLGAEPIYHEAGGEFCGAVVRYGIVTKQTY